MPRTALAALVASTILPATALGGGISIGVYFPAADLQESYQNAYDVSDTGLIVGGAGANGFVRTLDGGSQPDWQLGSVAVSADGTAGLGFSSASNTVFRYRRFIGIDSLPSLPLYRMQGWGISGDGSVAVGFAEPIASGSPQFVRWVGLENPQIQVLGAGYAYDITPDGTRIAGSTFSQVPGNHLEPMIYTDAAGVQRLGLPAGYYTTDGTISISADGSAVVGTVQTPLGLRRPFLWTEQVGAVALDDVPGGIGNTYGRDVSGDGSIVVGQADVPGGTVAFLWDQQHGTRRLADVLADLGVSIDPAFHLEAALGISNDGTMIVGIATHVRDGVTRREPFVAIIPAPGVAASILIGGLAVGRSRRR